MEPERSQLSSVGWESIVATPKLNVRACRTPNLQEENHAFHELANSYALDPENFLNKLVDVAARLCDADTVGISVEETDVHGQQIFRWVAIAGALKQMVGGTTPRSFSPCGVCVDTNQPLLMQYLDRVYPYFKEAPLPFVEALLLPWGAPGGPVGTFWVVAHNDRRKFDLHDVRLMTSFAAFAFGAICLRQRIQAVEHIAADLSMRAALAHHINNPLQAVLFATFLLKTNGMLNPEALELLTVLEAETRRIATLSSGFLGENIYVNGSEFPGAQFAVVLKGAPRTSSGPGRALALPRE